MSALKKSTSSLSTEMLNNDEVATEMVPDFRQAQQIFEVREAERLSRGGDPLQATRYATLKDALLSDIIDREQGPLYRSVCAEFNWPVDPAISERLAATNAAALASLDAKVRDAEANLSENDIREALAERATYLVRICDSAAAPGALRRAEEATIGLGQRIDLICTRARLGLFLGDYSLAEGAVSDAEKLLERGADWDRKNKLKVYRGVLAVTRRDLRAAASLFLDTLTTFSCYEMFSDTDFVALTAAVAYPVLGRSELRARLLEAPEFVAVADRLGGLGELVVGLQACNYSRFFPALLDALAAMKGKWVLAPHADFICAEMRVRTYAQMLECYRSVQLEAMARDFGVSVDFLDRELSRFISAGRLNGKIDRIAGLVETTRPDSHNLLYQNTIKDGDALLNRIQKLVRLVV